MTIERDGAGLRATVREAEARVRYGARLRLEVGPGAIALTRDEARAAILALETALREGR